MKNLMAYYLTDSKTVVTQDAGYPSSSYSGIQAWIKTYSEDPLQCPDNADVVTFLDNNQVLQRKWRVQTDFKSTSSVITTIVHIIPDKTASLQHKTELSPRQWLNVEERVNVEDALLTKIQNQFIAAQLNIIFQQQTSRDGTITDVVNDEIISPHTKPQDRYTFIPSRHPDEKPVVIMGDPAFENPCSYESVEKVFNHILEQTNIGSNDGRKWTMVGFDGLPYALGSRMQDSFFKCDECTREFVCREEFEEHRKEHSHCMLTPLINCRKYNNIVLIPAF
ncbi:uncharacterized protein [Mytilus edulis]|uniref:uncharacterized protein n=1 Tax=Mytilus edulis TaxID=6550 RepID=UPI0039EEA060